MSKSGSFALLKTFLLAFSLGLLGWSMFVFLAPPSERCFLQQDGSLSPPFKRLSALIGIKFSVSPEIFLQALDSHFRRSNDQERWELSNAYEDNRPELINLFQDWGMVREVLPTKKDYDVVFIHGSTVENARERFTFLMKLWDKGLRVGKIIVLTSDRRLDPRVEGEDILFSPFKTSYSFRTDWVRPPSPPRTEQEAMKMVWQQVITNDELFFTPIQFIGTPSRYDSKIDKKRRPYAYERLETWINDHAKQEKGKRFLLIVNNPLIAYHEAVLKDVFAKTALFQPGISIEVVGGEAKKNTKITVYLDTIARTLDASIHNIKNGLWGPLSPNEYRETQRGRGWTHAVRN